MARIARFLEGKTVSLLRWDDGGELCRQALARR